MTVVQSHGVRSELGSDCVGDAMSVLFARCPTDGTRISTGIHANGRMLGVFAKEKVLVQCDRCREYHVVRVADLTAEPEHAAHEPTRGVPASAIGLY